MEELYKLKDSKKVITKHIMFYRKLRDNKIIDQMHQLFTYACLVGVKADAKVPGSKTDDICTIGSIDPHNLEVVKAVILMKIEPKDADDLLKEIQEYADGGIEILMKDYENEGTIRLDKYI